MRKYSIFTQLTVITMSLFACNNDTSSNSISKTNRVEDSIKVRQLLEKSDSIYALKQGLHTFIQALDYTDSAFLIAQSMNNHHLLSKVYFNKASVFNAWNGYPTKTTEYFKKALEEIDKTTDNAVRKYYIMYLIAHSYDGEKANDSANSIRWILKTFKELQRQPDSLLHKMTYAYDLGWVAAHIKNFTLADSLNKYFTRRKVPLINDPLTNNYRDHYILTQTKIDILGNGHKDSPYLDTLEQILASMNTPVDSLELYRHLIVLYEKINDENRIKNAQSSTESLRLKTENKLSVTTLENKLILAELMKKDKENEIIKLNQKNQRYLFVFLCITILSFIIIKIRDIKIKKKMATLNIQLEEKVNEIELVNQDTHHRVKNSLYGVYSLVKMQERSTDNETVLSHLKNIRNRIESISLLYQQLSSKEFATNHSLKSYIQNLVENITKSYHSNYSIVFQLHITEDVIDNKHNFPLGLIINELVTNSIKYAQPDASSLIININITHEKGSYKLSYYDNGNNTSKTYSNNTEGIGYKIITMMCNHMKYKLTHQKDNPYHYQIIFNQ